MTDLGLSDRGHVADLSHPDQAWQCAQVCSSTDNFPQRRSGQSGHQRRPHKVSTIHCRLKGSVFSMNRACLRCKTAENFAGRVQPQGTPNIHPGLIPSPCWKIALEILATNSPWDTKVASPSRGQSSIAWSRSVRALALLRGYTTSSKFIGTESVMTMHAQRLTFLMFCFGMILCPWITETTYAIVI